MHCNADDSTPPRSRNHNWCLSNVATSSSIVHAFAVCVILNVPSLLRMRIAVRTIACLHGPATNRTVHRRV